MLTRDLFAVANLVKHYLSIRQCKSSGEPRLVESACSLESGLRFRSLHMSVRIISRK